MGDEMQPAVRFATKQREGAAEKDGNGWSSVIYGGAGRPLSKVKGHVDLCGNLGRLDKLHEAVRPSHKS
ncbi:hypothetical protein ACLOJK_041159 [Asimina triloba]